MFRKWVMVGILLVVASAEMRSQTRLRVVGIPTIQAASCSSADINTAIGNQVSGGVVILPAPCTITWAGTVAIPNTKGITLDCNGAIITGVLTLAQHATQSSRITDCVFTATSGYTTGFIQVSGSSTSAAYRVDHNTLTHTLGGVNLLDVAGNSPGLIDNNAFNCPTNCEHIHNLGLGPSDTGGWGVDVVPGGGDAVYIEDNTFTNNDPDLLTTNPAYFFGNSALQSYYGARTVFRYNTLYMSQVDQHGTAGAIGARWWEIYENEFQIVANGNQSTYMDIRAGSGVIFNNTKTGAANLGAGNVSLREEDSGYPALYQIGRGKDQVLDPAYVWGNAAALTIASGSANVVADRDFYQSTKPGYTAYPYPHPSATP